MRSLIKIAWLLVFYGQGLMAATTDAIHLEAESGHYDGQKGIATYEGKVLIRQGEMELRGDVVRLHFQDNKVVRIEAQGKPARFHYRPAKAPATQGEGREMSYELRSKQLNIRGEAHIKQGKNELRAAQLNYDLQKEYIKSQRVKIIFHPDG